MARLNAALDAEEALARSMPPFPWRLNEEGDEVVAADGEIVCEPFALSNQQMRNMARYLVDHDPQATLERIAAAREILDEHKLTVTTCEQDPYDPLTGEPRPAAYDIDCSQCGWCSDNPKSGCRTSLAVARMFRIEVES